MSLPRIFSQPFGVLWRTALVRAPRAVPDQILRFTTPEGPQPFVLNLSSRGGYRIPVYVFVPASLTPEQAASLPVVIDFHGGGFFLGSCLEQAPFCAKLARELSCVALTVDYRMGPVDRFPAAIEDAEDVLDAVLDSSKPAYAELRMAIAERVLQNARDAAKAKKQPPSSAPSTVAVDLDTHRIAVSGFSSGGNLALNTALSINPPQIGSPWPSRFPRDHPSRIPLLLYYPSFDSRLLPSERTKPPNLLVSGSFWTDVNDVLQPTYLPRGRAHEPRASPGLADIADGGLHDKARMLLVLPELDTLAEQSETWVGKVLRAGRAKDLRVERFPGLKHGWTQMPESWLGEEERRSRREIFEETVEFVRDAWAGKEMEAKA